MTAWLPIGFGSPTNDDYELTALAQEAGEASHGDARERLEFAARWGALLPPPGQGRTRRRWEMLATVGSVDLTTARTLEPQSDALAIMAEAGVDAPPVDSTWGVYAAEGPGQRLTAHLDGGRWFLTGTKPWCSLAGQVSNALVTAWTSDDTRGLFQVTMPAGRTTASAGSVAVEAGAWVSRGLADVVSRPVTFTDCPATAVGGPGWYLTRSGFAWGGIGVAAVWYGAAVALARRLRSAGASRPPDQIGLAHLGGVDLVLTGARAVLSEAAAVVDAGGAEGPAGVMLALRARGVVADAAERALVVVGHALGPGPLTQDEEHARRVADLQVYVRQHHAERDAAALGSLLHADDHGGPPW